MSERPTGVLLINLGTPKSPEIKHVRSYLAQFLMDPLVIDMPAFFRWLFVNLIIIPRRVKTSAAAYRSIWTDQGSPLLVHHLELGRKVQENLGSEFRVRAVMRYGEPSIRKGLEELMSEGVGRLIVLPLYPQYSQAATQSSVDETKKWISKLGMRMPVRYLAEFFREPGFVDAFGKVAENFLSRVSYSHLIFSYHGLPERQVKKLDPTGSHCLASEKCCDVEVAANAHCYRNQCFQTTTKLVSRLGLKPGSYSIGFQSRLGPVQWIRPFTDHLIPALAAKGVKRLAVMSPAFVADCLETLEEIQMRLRRQFLEAGGEELYLVPSLNSSDGWVKAVAEMVKET
jgi:ferrochelatase